MANGKFGGGNGTTSAPYLVEDEADLRAVMSGLTKHYKQSRDIVMSREPWKGIGSSNLPFTGTFDGAGYKITNLFFRFNNLEDIIGFPSNTVYIGMFNAVTAPGVIRNINVESIVSIEYGANSKGLHHGITTIGFGGIVGAYSNPNVPIVNCHSKIVANTEFPRDRAAQYISGITNLMVVGIVCQVSGAVNITSCSSDITINHKAIVSSQSQTVYIYPDLYTASLSGATTDFKFRLQVNTSLSNDNFGTRTLDTCNFYFSGMSRNRCTDCEMKDIKYLQEVIPESSITVPMNVLTVLMATPIRCSLLNSRIRANGMLYPFGGNAKDCKTVGSTLISINNGAYGINYTSSNYASDWDVARCLVKDCYIEGFTDAAGIGNCNATDCSVSNTNVKSAGRVAGIISGNGKTVTRSVFSGGWVEGNFSHIGGILNSTTADGGVVNSFFLGQYVKGLGATTIQSGIVSSLGHTRNANNYVLDTAQLILE